MYLKGSQDLKKVLQNPSGAAVILNKPRGKGGDEALPLGRVLSGLLDGPTHSFTALVGFFGHRVEEDAVERYEHVNKTSDLEQLKDEDLAELIVHEAIEASLQEEQDFDHTAFLLCP